MPIERTQEISTQLVSKTVVPVEFFDELVAAMDEPVHDNAALKQATRTSRERLGG